MRIDWVPWSAAALVAGATAISVGALLVPSGSDSSETLRLAEQQDGRWLAVSLLYFLAAVALTVGLPSILTLFSRRGSRLGLIAVGVFTIGCVGTAGYGMLLAFVRALVLEHAIAGETLTDVTRDPGLAVLLYGWIGAFLVGEALLAAALWRARTTGRWISVLLFLHVALVPVSSALPGTVQSMSALLLTVALSGIGITAAAERYDHGTRQLTALSG